MKGKKKLLFFFWFGHSLHRNGGIDTEVRTQAANDVLRRTLYDVWVLGNGFCKLSNVWSRYINSVLRVCTCSTVEPVAKKFGWKIQRWNPWSKYTNEEHVKMLHENGVLDDRLLPPMKFPRELMSLASYECQETLLFRWTSTCRHDVRLKRSSAFKILTSRAKAPPCKVQVR